MPVPPNPLQSLVERWNSVCLTQTCGYPTGSNAANSRVRADGDAGRRDASARTATSPPSTARCGSCGRISANGARHGPDAR